MTVAQSLVVPMVDLVTQHAPLKDELLQATARVFDHGQFVSGSEVDDLETRWACRCQTQHAVSVSDGTTALRLALDVLGVGRGDEVIVPPHSFVATAACVVAVGATPVFADVGDDFNIDPCALRQRITPNTKAIIAVHLTGRPADMTAINDIADLRGLVVIEDAAQAMGAKQNDRPVGSLSRVACFSLNPLKTASACGDAGMMTTDDDRLASRLRLLRNHGFQRRQEDCQVWGHNARMDTLQAAFALVKLRHLDRWIQKRRTLATIYRRRLPEQVRIPEDRPEDFAAYHTFPVEVDRRDELARHLADCGIATAVHYRTPIHLLDAAKHLGYQAGDFPVAERLSGRILSLPIHQDLNEDQIIHVCDSVSDFYG